MTNCHCKLIAVSALALCAPLAMAADTSLPRPSVTPDWFGLAGNLMLILAMIGALAWFVRRQRSGGGAGGNAIRVLAAQSLGTRERVVVVEVAGQQLVLGQTGSSLTTLHVPSTPLITEPAAPTSARFAERLRKALTESKA